MIKGNIALIKTINLPKSIEKITDENTYGESMNISGVLWHPSYQLSSSNLRAESVMA